MSEFTVIETQEQLNSIIGERLERARNSAIAEMEEKYSDYEALKTQSASYEEEKAALTSQIEELNQLKEKYSGYDQTIEELEKKVSKYESDSVKMKIANELGLPMDLIDRINGSTAEEIKEDAEKLAKLFSRPVSGAPSVQRNAEAGEVDGVMEAFKKLNPNLNI